MNTQVTHESRYCPRCDCTTHHECTRVTGANGAVAVEFHACEVCGSVN